MNTTPNKISENILGFCREIDSTTKPVFLKLFHVDSYIPGECYGNVAKHIETNEGEVQYGWIIWEDPKILLEAEFHAVWINKKGEYIDVTPKVDKEARILFLPDSKKKFNGELIDNIRKPLADNAYVRNLMKAFEKGFEIKKRCYKSSPITERAEFDSEEINKDKLSGKVKIGVNKPCPCGSGKKYKKCCRTIK